MLNFLARLFKRKKKPAQRAALGPTGYARGHSPASGRQDPLLDPLNPMSPVSPMYPTHLADSYEPARSSSSCANRDYSSYDGGSSYSSSESSSSSDSGSSSSSCD
ncbi:hypothetical protein EDP1_1821 [Pseudomonas putida S610]|uniref:hypothetical protein n=1 Tax=Pseudomonas putida group TaxID=136845 RepID=UPI0003C62B83|nr:hypothetical protein [Pseudomonas putida]EST15350.1 hypothetical protein EDP1_1821 [Pseudomonas putida S610]